MPSTGHDRPDQRTLLFRQRIPHQRAAKVVLDRLALRMEHVEPFRPLLGLVDHAGDTSKLTRQADIEPEAGSRSEEHTSELHSLMRISYAVFRFKKKQATSSAPSYTHQSQKLYTITVFCCKK